MLVTCTSKPEISDQPTLHNPWKDQITVDGKIIIREYHRIPFIRNGEKIELEGLLYKEDGLDSYRGVIMTHGRDGPKPSRYSNEIYGYKQFNQECALKGCAVLFLVRRGYGNSGGKDSEYLSTAFKSGQAAAEDINAGIDYLLTLPKIKDHGIIIAGHSQGGWASLSASTINRKEVLMTINISGGTNFIGINSKPMDEIQQEWIRGCGEIGKYSLKPSLWIYSENDRNHPKSYVERMFRNFESKGGTGELFFLPPYKDNGHSIIKEPKLFIDEMFRYINEYELRSP